MGTFTRSRAKCCIGQKIKIQFFPRFYILESWIHVKRINALNFVSKNIKKKKFYAKSKNLLYSSVVTIGAMNFWVFKMESRTENLCWYQGWSVKLGRAGEGDISPDRDLFILKRPTERDRLLRGKKKVEEHNILIFFFFF